MEVYSIFFLLSLLAQVQLIDCQLHINITENGKDKIDCVWKQGYPCKTLAFAFWQTPIYYRQSSSVNVLFNVTYNQTISQSQEFKFTSTRFYVSVVGFNNVFLNLRPKQGIVIMGSR